MFCIGDKVVEVSEEFNNCPSPDENHPQDGHVEYQGKCYTIHDMCMSSHNCLGLMFEEDRGAWWCAGSFRKIEPADPAFIEEMRNITPKITA